jgi:hypothetical protein
MARMIITNPQTAATTICQVSMGFWLSEPIMMAANATMILQTPMIFAKLSLCPSGLSYWKIYTL